MKQNIAAMGPFDWVALFCATYVVGLSVAGELKDIRLCLIAITRLGGNELTMLERNPIVFLGIVRRFACLPAIVVTTVFLVCMQGGDALSVCFNTIALLFLTELDNVSYMVGLSERDRRRVEASDIGRVDLCDAEAKDTARTKTIHVAIVVITTTGVIWAGGHGASVFGALLAPALTFWVGGMLEAVSSVQESESSLSSRLKLLISVSAQSLAGFFIFMGAL